MIKRFYEQRFGGVLKRVLDASCDGCARNERAIGYPFDSAATLIASLGWSTVDIDDFCKECAAKGFKKLEKPRRVFKRTA